jgi:hypothetical protein
MTTAAPSCAWCGHAFAPRRGGTAKVFCTPAHRAAYHRATRQWCEREIAAGRLTVESLRNGAAAAYTLRQQDECPSTFPEMRSHDAALPDALERFRVEVSRGTINSLLKLGWLRGDQRHDLAAIMAALKRLGREPDILRVT